MCYGTVGCLFDSVFCLCVTVKSVAHLIDFLPEFVMGVSFAYLIRVAACFLWESLLLVRLGLLPSCYRKVVCSFD